MRTVDLPNGHKATLREGKEITGRGKKTIRAAMLASSGLISKVPAFEEGLRKDPVTDEPESVESFLARVGDQIKEARLEAGDLAALETIKEAAIVAQLDSWTRDDALPDLYTIGTLDGETYDVLMVEVGALPAEALGAGFAPNPDDETPTVGSDSSSGLSPAEPDLSPTPTPSNAGSPTSGDVSSPEQ